MTIDAYRETTAAGKPARADHTRGKPKRARKPKRTFDVNHQRRRDIARLVVRRHGKLAKAALCIPYAAAAAWHCSADSDRRFLMMQWCRWVCAPPSTEREIDAILEANPPRRISADTLARHLAVSDAERTDAQIWTIGAYNFPKAERLKRRKEKHKLRAQQYRRANGGKPREQAISRTKPWELAGFRCRRTWERHGKPLPQLSQVRAHEEALLPSLSSAHVFATSAGSDAETPRSPRRENSQAARQQPDQVEMERLIAALARIDAASASREAWGLLTWEEAGAWVASAAAWAPAAMMELLRIKERRVLQ